MREYLHAKIHKAIVTEANIDYIGSITIDKILMDNVWLNNWEKVIVSDNTNWARLETYVIPGKKWEICMNGAAAHLIKKWDEIIIMGFEFSDTPVQAKIILVDKDNGFIQYLKH